MNSLWISDSEKEQLYNKKPDQNHLETDVCIIGAGIFGLTCAYYLSKSGYKVIVLEKTKLVKKQLVILLEKLQVSMAYFMIILQSLIINNLQKIIYLQTNRLLKI